MISTNSELGTLEWDTFIPHFLIQISNLDTFNFLLNPLFFGWRAKFQISQLLIRDSDWLNFIHFSGYKYKIRLVSRLRKRKYQALISISTIRKFAAQLSSFNDDQKLLSKLTTKNYYQGCLLLFCSSNKYSFRILMRLWEKRLN